MPNPSTAHDDFSEDEFELGPALRSSDSYQGYDARGKLVDVSDPNCVARKAWSTAGRRVRCWVRVAMSGSQAGHYYNPNPTFDRPISPNARLSNGNACYAWRPIEPGKFALYLRFLETRDINLLRQAERM